MIELIFTIDYELYGDGTGSLREHVIEPARLLDEVFQKWSSRFVVFVEAAEFEVILKNRTDPEIDSVINQIEELYRKGHEVGLHLHPQWYNAKSVNGIWELDAAQYNLCRLPAERIRLIVARSIGFLRDALKKPDFLPVSFRAGNWLFQPTQPAAKILFEFGIRIDSSVFKGGFFREYAVDYRAAQKNGYYWRFWEDAALAKNDGALLELPTHAEIVPPWRMITLKRLSLQKKAKSIGKATKSARINLRDILHSGYPMKLDFCRMTRSELEKMVSSIIREDQKSPSVFKPIVAIGHTKDLNDIETVEYLVEFLHKRKIPISTLNSIYVKCV